MSLNESNPADKLVNSVKRNCKMCATYRNFQPTGKERPIVKASLKELYDYLMDEYNGLKSSNAPGSEVVRSANNRRFVLDLIDDCNACGKEVDLVNQKIKGRSF